MSGSFFDKIEIVVDKFSNPGNRIISTGKCCDGDKDASSCSNGCDTYFAVCITISYANTVKCLFQNHSRIFTNGPDFRSTLNTSQPNPPNLVSIKLKYWMVRICIT